MDKIVICKVCCGHGAIEYDVGAHKSKYTTVTCQNCKGSGRCIELQTTTFEPFEPGFSAERKY